VGKWVVGANPVQNTKKKFGGKKFNLQKSEFTLQINEVLSKSRRVTKFSQNQVEQFIDKPFVAKKYVQKSPHGIQRDHSQTVIHHFACQQK
jgi:hypothetical protein